MQNKVVLSCLVSEKIVEQINIYHIEFYILLSTTSLEKDLGVLVDNELNFENHIDHVIKKSSSKKAQILRNFDFRSKKVLVPLFKTLVRPIIEYANCLGPKPKVTNKSSGRSTKKIH